MTDSNVSWACIQISALLPRAVQALHEAAAIIGVDGLERDLTRDEMAAFKHAVSTAADLTERTQMLASDLPDTAIQVEHQAVSAGAAEDLANGILEPERALLAASTLGLSDGFTALAEALRTTEVHNAWGELTIDELLARFEGADGNLLSSVLSDAGLSMGTTFEDLDDEAAARLAASLARHTDGYLGG